MRGDGRSLNLLWCSFCNVYRCQTFMSYTWNEYNLFVNYISMKSRQNKAPDFMLLELCT